jgi:thioredoxin-related protein
MKKLFVVLFLSVVTLFAKVEWSDFDDAYELAKEKNKNIMLMFSREECAACEYMRDVVFVNKAVSEYMNENYILCKVDVQQDFMPQGFEVIGTPTFYFLDEDAKVLDVVVGAKNFKDFQAILEKYKK